MRLLVLPGSRRLTGLGATALFVLAIGALALTLNGVVIGVAMIP